MPRSAERGTIAKISKDRHKTAENSKDQQRTARISKEVRRSARKCKEQQKTALPLPLLFPLYLPLLKTPIPPKGDCSMKWVSMVECPAND